MKWDLTVGQFMTTKYLKSHLLSSASEVEVGGQWHTADFSRFKEFYMLKGG